MGTPSAMLKVKNVVESQTESVVVVVSALGGVTDQLIAITSMAAAGDETYTQELAALRKRHIDHAREVVPASQLEGIEAEVEALLDELQNILTGVFLIREASPKTNDAVVSYGERLSSLIISAVIDDAVLYDARELIKTHKYYNRHIVDMVATEELIKKRLKKNAPQRVVMGGFISSDKDDGDVTNLGRGGSDYTASLMAAVLDASALEIWTDVEGFMTADPRVVQNAYVIDRMSYVEAMELCNFGAKIIYPPTIFPVYHKNIPIILKDTFKPEHPGTYISSEDADDRRRAIKGISSVNDTSLITMRGLGMVGVIGVNYRIFKALAKAGISVFLVSQAASENTTSIGVRNNDAALAEEVMSEEFANEIAMGEIDKLLVERDLATVAIVGENMKHTPGIAGKLFGTLGRNGINVIACAQGASETNISFVVSLESLNKAMNVIHDSFFLSEYQVLNVFMAGVGLVGQSLLEQIRIQQPKLMKDNALQIKVVGITNSRKYLVNPDGIDLSRYKELLSESDNVASPERFRDEIVTLNMFNSVFVDCTASADVATIYKSLLEANVSVVTANKIAASSEYEVYDTLKTTARRLGVKYLFETNVGAGLPVINTIGDLRNSGDKILKIEAVVSGTLNYIFNVMSEDVPMSRAIKMAQEAGYAEPDPRIDLSGTDVIRKLVILSRESGYKVEQDDVEKHLFIPEKYFKGTVDDFWRKIPELDVEFETKRKELAAKGLRWKFIATLDKGKTSVALREVDSQSPFFNLEGSNNVISITTERYKEYPMQIKGFGAGANVTAAGVFADIISIANIR